LLLTVFRASTESFRTAWFIESLLTELVIALVVRTRRRFYRSRPGKLLLYSTIALIVLTFAIPYLPFVRILGFVPLPPMITISLALISAAYVVAAEMTKSWFYRHEPARPAALVG
jgi:Mg2+-importing ATPase